MWMSVDRVEGNKVVLIDENEKIYTMTMQDYLSMVGVSPQESHMLLCQVENDKITSAAYSSQETERRLASARARLERLIQRNKT